MIQILKEIPWKVQQLHKEYFFSTKFFNDAKIQYKSKQFFSNEKNAK